MWKIPKRDPFRLLANSIESFVIHALNDQTGLPELERKNLWEWMSGLLGETMQEATPIAIGGKNLQERVESVASSLNPLFRVPLEALTNRKFFFHQDIVPSTIKPFGSTDQLKALGFGHKVHREGTREMYKVTSEVMTRLLPKPLKHLAVTPLMIKHWVEGFTANLITQAFPKSDRKKVEEAFDLRTVPFVGGVVKKFTTSGYRKDQRVLKAMKQLGDDERERVATRIAATTVVEKLQGKKTDKGMNELLERFLPSEPLKDAIEAMVRDKALGRSNLDSLIMSMGVKNGSRARYIMEILGDLSPKQRAEQWEDWKEKEMLTNKTVLHQISDIAEKKGSKD